MDTDSINSLLKYFPYTEAEKAQVRELLIKRDPALMSALNNFLSTKDVTALNREFKVILSQQGPSTVYKTGVTTYSSPSIGGYSGGVSTYTTGTSGSYTTSQNNAYGGTTLIGGNNVVGGATTTVSYGATGTTYGGNVGTSVYSAGAGQQQTGLNQQKSVSYQENLKVDVGGSVKKELTESVKRSKVETQENIKKLKRMSEFARAQDPIESPTKVNVLKTFSFDFMPQEIKNNHIDADIKKKLIEMSSSLSFENFIDIRHFLRLDKIDLLSFIDKAFERVKELHPLKPGQDASTYNPGFSLEEFIVLLCGDSEIPKSKMGYIGLLFYYMDYNHNQILETDEILQGFIMLGPGDKKDKITAAFHALGGKSYCLTETELAHYFEIVIRVYKLREDLGNDERADLYDIQKAIDLAAKSLARKIFETIDYDESHVIALEEFLIWHDRIESKQNMFELKKDSSFLRSLELAKESKKKRLDNIFYSVDELTQVSTKEKFKKDILDNGLHVKTLEGLKKTLKVDQIDVGTAVKVFKSMNYSKALTVKEFHVFFENMYTEEKVKFTPQEQANVKQEIVRLFQILDTNKNGVLEWDELMSALIFVLRGSESEKARIAFQQFDTNGDGVLQFKEFFFFLKGVFNILMYANQHDLFKKDNPETIAFATAKEAFTQLKLNIEKDAIDYRNFQKFYTSNL